jgi:hypothetical protein
VWYSKNYSGARKQLEGRFQPDRSGVGERVSRLDREIRQIVEVAFVPLAILLGVTVLVALVYWWARGRPLTLWRRAGVSSTPERRQNDGGDTFPTAVLRVLATNVGFVAIVLVAGVAALLYGREAVAQWVPLVPYAIVLVVACLASLPAGWVRSLLAGGLVVVSLLNLAMLSDLWTPLGRVRTVDAPGLPVLTVTDGRHWVDAYLADRGHPTGRAGHLPETYDEWLPMHREVVETIVEEAAAQGEPPVVLLRQVDPIFGPNDLLLADRLASENARLGVGPLRDRHYREQLNSAEFGQPNFVMVLDEIPGSKTADEQRASNADARRALRTEGFEIIRVFELPDGRDAELWYRPRPT